MFEYLQDQGEMRIFLWNCYHARVHELLWQQIENHKSDLLTLVHECGVSQDNDNVRIIIGTGRLVKRVFMPDEYRTVMVKARKDDYSLQWPMELICILSGYMGK